MDEAISAVADEGFLGDEDDDYEDLYNDVNVGENFLQSMRKNDDSGFRNEVVEEKRSDHPMVTRVPPSGGEGFPVSGVADGAGSIGAAGGSGAMGYQNQGFRGNEVKGHVGSAPVVGGGSGGMRVELAQRPSKANEMEEQNLHNSVPGGPPGLGQQLNGSVGNLSAAGIVGGIGNEGLAPQGSVRNMSAVGGNGAQNAGSNSNVVALAGPGVGGNFGGGGGGGGGTMLFVGDLHWWTTDTDLEVELCKYGQVKEVKFFDEKASGKSKGYCQVEFFEASAATACKEGMNGHLFNGKACVVAFATPFTIKRMGEAQVNRGQQMIQSTGPQARRGPNDMVAKTGGNNIATGGDFQGGDNRGFGRGNWGRGNGQGMGNRGAVGGPMRNRGGGMGGRGLMGNGGHGFGQGMAGGPPMLHPQSMMGQGFDPAFGGPMGRLGAYGGFPGAPGPFSGLMPSFPPVGGVGLHGVAPHVNPAIFGRGMPINGMGMGMMPTAGMEGPNSGMWSDPSMSGWGGDEHGGGRAGESSYGEEAASEHQYSEANHDRGGWPNSSKEKERVSERDWSGSSDRKYPEDRETYDRDVTREKDTSHDREWSERRHRDERDSGREKDRDHERERERSRDRDRERDRERERDRDRDRERYREDREKHADEYERGRSSRTHSKSRLSQEEDHHLRSRDTDYGKRRRD